MCPDLVPNERKKAKRYIRGFLEGIKGNITSLKPTTLHDAINIAHELVEQAVQGIAARVSESNKRKWEDHQRNTNNNNPNNKNQNQFPNNHHQQQNRRQETTRAYAAAPTEKRGYAGNLPKCNCCNSYHNSQCPPKFQRCQRTRHQEKDCRARVPGVGVTPLQDVICYGCGDKGHYKNICLKGRNHILFDSGAEKSFVSTEFTPFVNISPATVNTICYGEILEIQGERPPKLISCIKTNKKKLEDIRIVCEFPEVFPNDLSGLPLVREIEFYNDLIPGALPVVKSPYRLTPSEMIELLNQLKEL
ncbi:putative reverse transcriptase domain-containing protein [Tanacetum coccineum]